MKTDYFALIFSQAQCSAEAAALLESILENYQPAQIEAQMNRMHEIEHRADNIRHEVIKRLTKEFITPIEQEDLMELTRLMDDVTDAIDEVVIDLYMYAVNALPQDALEMARAMRRCVDTLASATEEFKNYKKPARLGELLIAVNTAESDADGVYMHAVRNLFAAERDPMRAVGLKAVYDSLETCCDTCEHAADVMESVVMNNL